MILNLNAQIIWVFVDLLILFVLMKKFLFGPITRMLDDRARGQQEYDRLVAEARTAVQRLEEQSAQRRESERAQMLREAKKELAALVLLTTAKVSRQTLDSDTDRAMIDDFLREETEAAR